jgi:hypothetical protein
VQFFGDSKETAQMPKLHCLFSSVHRCAIDSLAKPVGLACYFVVLSSSVSVPNGALPITWLIVV